MKIQKRLLLYVGGSALLMFFFVFFLFSLLVVNGVQETEDAYALQTVKRFDFAIVEKEDFLSRMVFDWSVWDDTYNFVKGDFPDFVDSNINEETFDNFGINAIIIVNDSGDISYGGYYDLDNHSGRILSAEEKSGVYSSLDWVRNYTFLKGLASVNDRIIIFASHRVYTSDNLNASGGFLIFAKYFDNTELKTIGNYVGDDVSVSVVSIKDEKLDYRNGTEAIAPGVYKRYIGEEYIECMRDVFDVDGNQIGVAHIIFYRGNYVRIMGALSSFLFAQTICLIIIGTIFFLVLQKSIVERVLRLNSLIFNILDNEDLSRRIDDRGDDEISNMSSSFNELLEIVNETKKDIEGKNDQLYKANMELLRLDELKSQFLANVSHETRTPLTAIQSYTELLQDEVLGQVNEKQKEALGVILTSSKSLNELLSEILDASKYKSGNVVLSKKKVNLFDLLNFVKLEFEPALSRIGGELIIDADNSLTAFVDEEKMVQVFSNLIGNSIKYRSERRLVIDIKAEEKNGNILISFRDNGMGLSKQTQEHVFDRFYRAPETSNKTDGAGLGLSIIKSIIDLHDGKIVAESRFGEYTLFRISLPAK
jgi:signal transduction histidine kinase